jgi:hypothetical protein
MARKTDLTMRGTKGRDCSPRSSQKPLMGEQTGKAPRGVGYTGVGTPLKGGKPPEAGASLAASGVIDPAMFNVDGHAIRVFSHYMEGKRAGPDWLHRRVEAAEEARFNHGMDMLDRS